MVGSPLYFAEVFDLRGMLFLHICLPFLNIATFRSGPTPLVENQFPPLLAQEFKENGQGHANWMRRPGRSKIIPSRVNQDLGQEGVGSQRHDLGSIIREVTQEDTRWEKDKGPC